MQPITTVVIDDELYSRDELTFLLEKHKDIKIIGEADSGGKGLEIIIRNEPDLAFIDIEMPQMSGLELAKALQSMKKVPFIIFATAYPDYAVKAFRVQALDYILKPFSEEAIEETIQLVKERMRSGHSRQENSVKIAKLAVEEDGRIVYISPEDILYLFREDRETFICTKECMYSARIAIKEIEEKLKGYPFFRTHKSYLVNLNKIEQLIPWFNGAFQLKIVGRMEEIPVSRNYVKALRQKLEL
ncbi:LytR/AlgR family response regulator transcription factor [Bacillus solitudinis]|uniref:LytR/AlgR family response regulator transcription factor n=1 Tax=Bacillus solitudinis TaxID=2014074 RepID=UPI000C23D838|nr:LytTR family DNA-binding domain-containing protein [Bacillus solitudinis]